MAPKLLAAAAAAVAACTLFAMLPVAGASTVLTYSDRRCTNLLDTITVEDSSGSGECTKVTPRRYQSFMLGTIGRGCGVTIYGNDPDDSICSATFLKLAEETICYNATWTYFSVDECRLPTTTSSSSSSPSTTPTSTSTSSTTTTPPSSGSGNHRGDNHIGAIVGGTISGVFVVGGLAGTAFYFFFFRPRQQQRRQQQEPGELAGGDPHPDNESTAQNQQWKVDDPRAKSPADFPLAEVGTGTEPERYELSPEFIAEAHEQTHVRHELPP